VDLLSVVEAAYDLEHSDASWLGRVAQATASAFPASLGCTAAFLDASDFDRLSLTGLVAVGMKVEIDTLAAAAAFDVKERSLLFGGKPVVSTSEALGEATWLRSHAYRTHFGPAGVGDAVGLIAVDASRKGCSIGLYHPQARKLRADERFRFAQLAVHVATGVRVRSALRASAHPTEDTPVEAILEPNGKLVHATEPAAARSARESLRQHAIAVDQARGRLRRRDEAGALDLWTALVAGRWTLVDRFDADGRRFLLACRNDPKPSAPLGLTLDERQVVGYIGLGHSNKLIGYELGRSQAWVSAHLKSALSKLGVRTRTELTALAQSLAPMSRSHCDADDLD
jgi:DNA-binding CsgD family transcriptional regulator